MRTIVFFLLVLAAQTRHPLQAAPPDAALPPAPTSVAALPPAALPPLPAEARRRLAGLVGRWNVEAQYLDADGKVTQTVRWRNHADWIIDGRVVLLTHDAPALGVLSKTFVYYDHAAEKFTLVDVNQKGELWILSGTLDAFVITSQPKPTPRGEMILRFAHEEPDADTTLVTMDYSLDGGTSWTRAQRQTIRRIVDAEPQADPADPADR